jgi:hypothetical protein
MTAKRNAAHWAIKIQIALCPNVFKIGGSNTKVTNALNGEAQRVSLANRAAQPPPLEIQ